MTHNFYPATASVYATGTLYMCLGQDDAADLRALRASPDDAVVIAAVQDAIARKPKGHDFIIDRRNPAPPSFERPA